MQYLDDIIGKRWRSGVVGKAYVVGMGALLSVCACSVLASFTRSAMVVPSPTDFTPAALWTLVPTTNATATLAPTDTPLPPTATLAPTVPARVVPIVPVVPIFACVGGCDTPPDDSCNIKGNISIASGERIYHAPGQAFYDETVINSDYGEKWFCTEDEAVEAGWRKAKQ